jgi:hypothetical protein
MSNKALTIKFGRPTKYSIKIPARALSYTNSCLKKGIFPSIEGLAINLGVVTRTIYGWEKEYEDFLHTTELLKDIQRDLLIKNGLNGKYSTSFAMFLLKALHGFSDAKPLFEATQNNYMNISPELLAKALKVMRENDSKSLSDEDTL